MAKKKKTKRIMIEGRTKPVTSLWLNPKFFSYLNSSDKDLQEIFRFYDFPRKGNFLDTSLIFTPEGRKSTMYLTNKAVKNILLENVIGKNRNTSLNVFYAGSKVIEKEKKTTSSVKHKGYTNITYTH